jgi:hypothetical protein
MNVFLSWSGLLSHEIAQALATWIPQVVQAVKPWLSSQDIEKGARWFEEIGESLSTTDFGILCLSSANIAAPWILFEAGALSKSLGQSRVCPVLINIKNIDLQGPLAQFNTTGIGKSDLLKLVETLNSRLPQESKRTETQLIEAFEVWWPHLERKIAGAIKAAKDSEHQEAPTPKRKTDDVLDELLDLTRSTAQIVSKLQLEARPTAQPSIVQRHPIPLRSTTVAQLAAQLNRPADALLAQLNAAGLNKLSPDDTLSESDKEALLDYLRRSTRTSPTSRKKIVLSRKRPTGA